MNIYGNIKDNLKESIEEIKPINHFIERGNTTIPVRQGETDEEVLKHLEQLGNEFVVEPTEEEKASGKYIQKQVYTFPSQTGELCSFEWVRNPDYMGESEEGDNNAKRIIDEFTNSKRTRDVYFKALDLISQLEYENYIDKDKYDECIKKLQDLYNGRDRNIKEAQVTDIYRVGQEDCVKVIDPIRNNELHYTIDDIEICKRIDTLEPQGSGMEKTNIIINGYVTPDEDFYKVGRYISIPATYNITDEEFEFNPFADIPYSEENDLASQLYDAVENNFENLKNQALTDEYNNFIR